MNNFITTAPYKEPYFFYDAFATEIKILLMRVFLEGEGKRVKGRV